MRYRPPSHTRYAESGQEIEMLAGKIKGCVSELKRIAEELDLGPFTTGHLSILQDSLESFSQEANDEIEEAEEKGEKE